MKQLEVLNNYSRAVAIGAYDRYSSGLFGKHDNVRRYWEDRFTRFTVSHFLSSLVAGWESTPKGVRVMDLGCGSGEGLEILNSLHRAPTTLGLQPEKLFSKGVGFYKGADISPAMVDRANVLYAANSNVHFEVADLNDGLPVAAGEPAYDIYFSSYGSLSHLSDEALRGVVADICDHMGQTAVFVADMLGRYSYEWPCYWNGPSNSSSNMERYSMSYIYPPGTHGEIEIFPMRYWGGDEFDQFIRDVAAGRGVRVSRRKLSDRSILVGRHTNTGEFNPVAPPLRAAVNSLHEFNQRTDLAQLTFSYVPHPDHPRLNSFFEEFQTAWNTVVAACVEALDHWQSPEKLSAEPPDSHPQIVQQAIRTIRAVVRHVQWFDADDPLANIVEPQLGYLLRSLEWNLQQGLGTAHGLLAMYEFHKE